MDCFDKKSIVPVTNWKPADAIAVVLILVFGALIAMGYDGLYQTALLAIAATYFSISYVKNRE